MNKEQIKETILGKPDCRTEDTPLCQFATFKPDKLVNSGVNICLVQKLANHRNIGTTQRYFNYNSQMLSNAVESLKI